MEFAAHFFDGLTARRHVVRVIGEDGCLRVEGADVALEVPLADVRAEPPMAGERHLLRLPRGALLDTDDAAAVRALFPRDVQRDAWLRRLEGRWAPALGALLAIGLFTTWVVLVGLPAAAAWAAERMPQAALRELGESSLAALDRSLCEPSLVAEGRQRMLRDGVAAVVLAGLPGRHELVFRACPGMGPNALALADGTIVVTDSLVKLAQHDDELGAVIAHEAAHVLGRHPVRLALQGAGVAILASALLGDAASISGVAVATPTVLLQTGYSRALEDEADFFAIRRMLHVGLSPGHFAAILERMHAANGESNRGTEPPGYLSTHPASLERIERARSFAQPR